MSATEHRESIDIEVQTHYLDEQSDPDNKRFVFSYNITITNGDSEPVQLLTRHWIITDGDRHVQEVEGQGVVGEQPVIQPGASYSYTSGTVISTEVGSMTGYYGMRTAGGEHFRAQVPAFTLALPHALH
ncbi:Co2+/Mg2+ efflux protein ApaG [Motiliproteus sp. SC1-56]|uniref:Co2+/Mg2+ efflux protein ApaG n=1 Tax=Motiliproteus sp. SC1-56 TaxID=2799565 RepID=UPI001A905981|nr:Co2+/Mg2+ efflux protein ApaG [Motiliproteus sp. SC1-56]